MSDYAQLLKEHALKATFQRMSILQAIENRGHMSVEDIYNEAIRINPTISLATIYKNIIVMVEKSVLVEVPISGKKSKYELRKSDHIHLVCTECGAVEDKPCIEATDRVFHDLTETEHFKLNKRQINLYGVCASCQECA